MNLSTSPAVVAAGALSRPDVIARLPGYFIAGTGSPVIMLHSSLGSKAQWTALAERLAARFRVIALDLAGYGDNAAPATEAASFTLDDEVRHVMARLDPLIAAHSRVHLVGHSYGGLVALRLAQSRRLRVASLTLYEPVAFRALAHDDATLAAVRRVAQRVARLVAAGGCREAAREFVDFWSGDGAFASLPLPAREHLVRKVDKLPLDFQAATSWPLDPEDLRSIDVPALLLVGNRGPEVTRRIHARLSALLPNSCAVAFDAGHMGPVTDGALINPEIEAFLDACNERDAASPATMVPPGVFVCAGSGFSVAPDDAPAGSG